MSDLIMNVRGAKVPVNVVPDTDPDHLHRGWFRAVLDDDEVFATTWSALRSALYEATEGDIPVKFVLVRKGAGEGVSWMMDGITRRMHSSQHGVVLVTFGDQKDQLGYGYTILSADIPADTRADLEVLLTEQVKLRDKINGIIEKYKIDLRDAVAAAKAASVQERTGE